MMSPKKLVATKKREKITIQMKEIIQKHEEGTCVSDLANLYRHSASTIYTILKNKIGKKEKKKLVASKGVSIIIKHCPTP